MTTNPLREAISGVHPILRGRGPLTDHPAKYSAEILDVLRGELSLIAHRTEHCALHVLDPFGGIGLIHDLATDHIHTLAVELEPEWAAASALRGPTWCGDFFDFPVHELFDAVVTSPTYGNRMADHHNAQDSSKRITYRHKLGRELSPNNSGAMQWGPEYRAFHERAWARCLSVLRPDGYMIVNVKDHIRKGIRQEVVQWHHEELERVGFVPVRVHFVPTSGMGFGQNGQTRVEGEHVLVFRKGKGHG